MIILAGCFDSTKFSNDKAANQSASGHTLRIFLYCSSRIVFLFYLTNYSYKYTKRPGKKQDIELPLITEHEQHPLAGLPRS
jgi:uncharacterized ion transporter superfamily protein YfcC